MNYDTRRWCTQCQSIQLRETFRYVQTADNRKKAICGGCYEKYRERKKTKAA